MKSKTSKMKRGLILDVDDIEGISRRSNTIRLQVFSLLIPLASLTYQTLSLNYQS